MKVNKGEIARAFLVILLDSLIFLLFYRMKSQSINPINLYRLSLSQIICYFKCKLFTVK